MEPQRVTPPHLMAVQEMLMAREPIFHRPEHGASRQDFEAMMAPEFWETGASGRRYSKAFVLDVLEKRHAESHDDPWETHDFFCQEVAPELYLLTYTLLQSQRVTRRATLWRHCESGWQIVYHQGTVVAD